MPVNLSVNVVPRTQATSRRSQPQPESESPTARARSALKRRLTGIFRERTGDLNGSNAIIAINNSPPNPRPLHRSASVSALKRKVAPPPSATVSNPEHTTQRNFPRESPPSYTILAPAPQDRLVVAHPSPSPPPSRRSSNASALSLGQLHVPSRTSSIICRQLQTSPSVADLDESSHTLIQSLYNEQTRQLERERVAQMQTDEDFAYALQLQLLQEGQDRAGQQALPRGGSTVAMQTQWSRTLGATPMQRSQSIATTQTQSSLPPTSAPPRFARECVICKRWKNFGAFPSFTPTELCRHESSTCSHCLMQWVDSKLKIRGAQGVNCSQCRILLNSDEIHRARVLGSSGYLGS